jgi:periplasmic protein TonB
MQARVIRDITATALGDRAWQRSLGASCLLHGAVLAALLITWHIEPKPQPLLRPIAVTLVHTDETAPERAAQPPQSQPEQPTPQQETAAMPPAPPVAAETKPPSPPAPPAKPPHIAPATAKPALPPAPAATPKPDATITALLSESLDGQPRSSAAPHGTAIALRSSAKLSDDYMLRLQAWIAREERYPTEARAHHQEGKGVVAFTIARDGKVTRVWIDQSTGSSLLDQASIATIRNASPVPPLPHDITGNSVDFFLPINYTLSNFERLFE